MAAPQGPPPPLLLLPLATIGQLPCHMMQIELWQHQL
jgi:hypothetical protein